MESNLKDYKSQAFDIVILAGQSNAEGCGAGPVQNEYVANKDVLFLNDNTWSWEADAADGRNVKVVLPPVCNIELAGYRDSVDYAGPVGDLSLSFSQRYIENGWLENGRKLLIVRAAIGGTGFATKYWGMEDILYRRMLAMTDAALALNKKNRVVAMLWHQGESDVNGSVEFDDKRTEYCDSLANLLSSVRERYKNPKLPVVTGGFCSLWMNQSEEFKYAAEAVVEGTRDACRRIGYSAFVWTDDVQTNHEAAVEDGPGWNDGIHFSRDGLRVLGRRYFLGFEKIQAIKANEL